MEGAYVARHRRTQIRFQFRISYVEFQNFCSKKFTDPRIYYFQFWIQAHDKLK